MQPAAVGENASTNGELRSTRRPDDLSIRSTRSRTSSWVSRVVVSSATPLRATKTWRRLVDPDLLHRRVVEVLLQRAVPRDRVPHRTGGRVDVGEHRHPTAHRPLVVVGDRLRTSRRTSPSSRAGSRPERRISSRTSPSSVWTASTAPPPPAGPPPTSVLRAQGNRTSTPFAPRELAPDAPIDRQAAKAPVCRGMWSSVEGVSARWTSGRSSRATKRFRQRMISRLLRP